MRTTTVLVQELTPAQDLVKDLGKGLDTHFAWAGKEFMRVENGTKALQLQAKLSARLASTIATYRMTRGRKEVSEALKTLGLTEFDK